MKSGSRCADESWLQVTGIDLIYNEDKNIISRTELKMPETAVPSLIPRESRQRSNGGTLDVGNERDRKKKMQTWMDAISVNLFDPLPPQMRMDGGIPDVLIGRWMSVQLWL